MSDKCVTWKLSEFQNLIPSYCNETKLIQLILIYKFPETNIFTISSRWLFESIFFPSGLPDASSDVRGPGWEPSLHQSAQIPQHWYEGEYCDDFWGNSSYSFLLF